MTSHEKINHAHKIHYNIQNNDHGVIRVELEGERGGRIGLLFEFLNFSLAQTRGP